MLFSSKPQLACHLAVIFFYLSCSNIFACDEIKNSEPQKENIVKNREYYNEVALGAYTVEIAEFKPLAAEAFKEKRVVYPTGSGAVIISATFGGFQFGDIITKFGSSGVKNPSDLSGAVRQSEPGKSVDVVLYRITEVKTNVRWKRITQQVVPERREKLIRSLFEVQRDAVSGADVYKLSGSPSPNVESAFYFCVVMSPKKSPVLTLRFQYAGKQWLFLEKAVIRVGEKICEYDVSEFDRVKRDNEAFRVWEWVDVIPDAAELSVLKNLPESDDSVVRLIGDTYAIDLQVDLNKRMQVKACFALLEMLEILAPQ